MPDSTTSWFTPISTRIQSQVGEFLQNKSTLLQLARSSDPNIVQQANTLLPIQQDLETQLPLVLDIVKEMQGTGGITLGGSAVTSVFYAKMVAQTQAVKSLAAKAPAGGASVPVTPGIIVGGIILGGAFLLHRMRR